MRDDPESVILDLKEIRDTVQRSPNVDPDVRRTLMDRIEMGLREASRRRIEFEQRLRAERANRAAAEEQMRLLDAAARRDELITQLLTRFNSLMGEGRFADALETASELRASCVAIASTAFPSL